MQVLLTGKDAQPEGALCDKCKLRDYPYVEGCGPDIADIVICGEAPGDTEVRRGVPFVGRAGMLLDKILEDAGIDRADCYLTNACCCRPTPHRAPKKDEIGCCRERLFKEIAARKPKVVIALGNAALKALTGRNGISGWHGAVIQQDVLNTYVVPTYHPAAVLRSPRLYMDLLNDVKKAVTVLKGDYAVNEYVTRVNYVVIKNETDFDKFMTVGTDIAIDVETASDGSLLCIGLSWSEGQSVVIDKNALTPETINRLNDLFKHCNLVGHNLKYDIQVLWRNGFTNARTGADTMLEHYTMNEIPGTHGLKQLAREYLNAPEYDEAVKPYHRRGFEQCPPDILWDYNAKDVAYTYQLHKKFEKMLDENNKRVLNTLLYPASDILARMESLGIMVNRTLLETAQTQYSKELEEIVAELHRVAGKPFNPNSYQQLIQVLYKDLELPVPGKLATDEDALNQIKEFHPIVDLLLHYRAKKKISSTYINALLGAADENDRVHTTFNLHGTVTGRLSSSHPVNL